MAASESRVFPLADDDGPGTSTAPDDDTSDSAQDGNAPPLPAMSANNNVHPPNNINPVVMPNPLAMPPAILPGLPSNPAGAAHEDDDDDDDVDLFGEGGENEGLPTDLSEFELKLLNDLTEYNARHGSRHRRRNRQAFGGSFLNPSEFEQGLDRFKPGSSDTDFGGH